MIKKNKIKMAKASHVLLYYTFQMTGYLAYVKCIAYNCGKFV